MGMFHITISNHGFVSLQEWLPFCDLSAAYRQSRPPYNVTIGSPHHHPAKAENSLRESLSIDVDAYVPDSPYLNIMLFEPCTQSPRSYLLPTSS